MKKHIKLFVFALAGVCVFASTFPPMPVFPTKYQTWVNYHKFPSGELLFDFYNYETSWTPQLAGFNKKGAMSFYGSKMSKYATSHRTLLKDSVMFCCKFFNDAKFLNYRALRKSLETFQLIYDGNRIELGKFIQTETFGNDKKYGYYSIRFIGYLDKEIFLKISKAKTIYLICEIDGEKYKFDLQIPKIYVYTFSQIKPPDYWREKDVFDFPR